MLKVNPFLPATRAARMFGEEETPEQRASDRLRSRIDARRQEVQQRTRPNPFLGASPMPAPEPMPQASLQPSRPPMRDDSSTLGSAAMAVASGGLGLAGAFGNVMDVPGSFVRDFATWVPGGIPMRNPLDQLLPWNWASSDGRTTEEELLESGGFYDDGPSENRSAATSVGRFAGELALGIAMDPLTYFTGGMTAYLKGAGKGAKAARAALKSGLIDTGFAAPNLLAKKAGTEAAGGATKLGREMGKREALGNISLNDLVKTTKQGDNADIVKAARESKEAAVNKQLGMEFGDLDVAENAKKAEEVMEAKIGEEGFFNFGVGIPFTDIGYNKRFFKGEKADKLARAVDRLGAAARFSPVGLQASRVFSKPLRNAKTAEGQKQALEEVEYLKEAGVTARSMLYSPIKKIGESEVLNANALDANGVALRTPEEVNTLSQAMSDYLEDIGREGGQVVEGSKKRVFDPRTTAEYRKRLKDTNPETAVSPYGDAFQQLDELGLLDELDKIKSATAKALEDAQAAGVKIEGLEDEFASYATRVRTPEDGEVFASREKKRYDPNTEHATKRKSHLRNHPLGTAQIQRMSLDERYAGVRDPKLTRGSDKKSAEMQALKERFASSDIDPDTGEAVGYGLKDQGFSDKDIDALWDDISTRNRELVERGVPFFEQNPATAALRNAEGLYQAAAHARGLKNFLKKIATLPETASMKRVGRDSNVAFDPNQEGGGVVDLTNQATFDFLGESVHYLDNLDVRRRKGDGLDDIETLRPVGPKTGPRTVIDEDLPAVDPVDPASPGASGRSAGPDPSSPAGPDPSSPKGSSGGTAAPKVGDADKDRALELFDEETPTEEVKALALKLRDEGAGDEEAESILTMMLSKPGWEGLLDEVEASPAPANKARKGRKQIQEETHGRTKEEAKKEAVALGLKPGRRSHDNIEKMIVEHKKKQPTPEAEAPEKPPAAEPESKAGIVDTQEPKTPAEDKGEYVNPFGRTAKETRAIAEGLGIDTKKKGRKKKGRSSYLSQRKLEAKIAEQEKGLVDKAVETVENTPLTRQQMSTAKKAENAALAMQRTASKRKGKVEGSPRPKGREFEIIAGDDVSKVKVDRGMNLNLQVPQALKDMAKQASAQHKAETGKSKFFSPYSFMLAILDEDLDANMWGEIITKMARGEAVDPELAAVVKQNDRGRNLTKGLISDAPKTELKAKVTSKESKAPGLVDTGDSREVPKDKSPDTANASYGDAFTPSGERPGGPLKKRSEAEQADLEARKVGTVGQASQQAGLVTAPKEKGLSYKDKLMTLARRYHAGEMTEEAYEAGRREAEAAEKLKAAERQDKPSSAKVVEETPAPSNEEVAAASLESDLTNKDTGVTVTPEQVHSVRQTAPEVVEEQTEAQAAIEKLRQQKEANIQAKVDEKLARANQDNDAIAAAIKAAKGQDLNNYLKQPEVAKLARERGINTKSGVADKRQVAMDALVDKDKLSSGPKPAKKKGGLAGLVNKGKRLNQAIQPSKAAMSRAGERTGIAGGSRLAAMLNSGLTEAFEPVLGEAAKDVASIVESISSPGDTLIDALNSSNPAMQRVRNQLTESGMLKPLMQEARTHDRVVRSANVLVSQMQVAEGSAEAMRAMGVRLPETIKVGSARAHDYLLAESKRLREAGNPAAADYALAAARPLHDSRGNLLGSRFVEGYANPDAVADLYETVIGDNPAHRLGYNNLGELIEEKPAAFSSMVDQLRDRLSNSFGGSVDFGTHQSAGTRLYQTLAGYTDMDDTGFFRVPFYDETSKYLDQFTKAGAKIDKNALLKNVKAEEAEYLELDLLFGDSPLKQKQEILDWISERIPEIEVVNLRKANKIQFNNFVVPGGDPSTYFEILVKHPPGYKGKEWTGSHWKQGDSHLVKWSKDSKERNVDQNIIAHLRGNIFTDESGNKILRLQENQSDYWQDYKNVTKPHVRQLKKMDKLDEGMPGAVRSVEDLREKLALGEGELNLQRTEEYKRNLDRIEGAVNQAAEKSGIGQQLEKVVEGNKVVRHEVNTDSDEFRELLEEEINDTELTSGPLDEEERAELTEHLTSLYIADNAKTYVANEDFEPPSLFDLAMDGRGDDGWRKRHKRQAIDKLLHSMKRKIELTPDEMEKLIDGAMDQVIPYPRTQMEEVDEMADKVLGQYSSLLFDSIDEIAPRKRPKGAAIDADAFNKARAMREQLDYFATVGDVLGLKRDLIRGRMDADLLDDKLISQGETMLPGGSVMSHHKSWSQLGMKTAMHVAAKNGLDGIALVDGADIANAVGGPPDKLRQAYEIVSRETTKYAKKIGGDEPTRVTVPEQAVERIKLRLMDGHGSTRKVYSAGSTHENEPLFVTQKVGPNGALQFKVKMETRFGMEPIGTASTLQEAEDMANDAIANSLYRGSEEGGNMANPDKWTQQSNVWLFNDKMKAKILEGQSLFQARDAHPGNRASISFPGDKPSEQWMDSQYMTEITAYDQALPLSYAHEMGHLWRMTLGVKAPEMLLEAERLLGVPDGNWAYQKVAHPISGNMVPAEEAFADAFMAWVEAGGKTPDEGWQRIWTNFKGFIQKSFSRVQKTETERALSPEMHQFFDNLLGESRYTNASRKTLMDVLDETKYANPRALNLLEDEFGPDQMGAAKDLVYMNRLRAERFKKIAELRKQGVPKAEDQVPLAEEQLAAFKSELAKHTDPDKTPSKIMGISTKVGQREALNEFAIPENVAADIGRVYGLATRLDTDSGRAQILKAYDRFTNVFKTNVTAIWPSFHVRNFTSGFVQNILNDIYDPTEKRWRKYWKPYQDAAALQTGNTVEGASKIKVLQEPGDKRVLTDEEATEEIVRLAYLHNMVETQGIHRDQLGISQGSTGNVIGAKKRDGLFFKKGSVLRTEGRQVPLNKKGEPISKGRSANPLEVSGGMRREGQFAPERYGRAIGDIIEGGHRLGGFIALMRQGYEPAEAAKRIKLAQVDYSDLTDSERQIGRRLVPFYSFSKGMGKYLASEIGARPGGKIAQTIRAANISREPDVTTPDYINEGVSLPWSTMEDGTRNYVTGLGLMHEAPVNMLDPAVALATGATFNPQKTLFKAGSNLNPLLKIIPETVFNQSMFQEGPSGGRSLDDMDPSLGRALSNVGNTLGLTDRKTPVPTPKLLETLLSNSPASRVIHTTRKAFDPRKGIMGKAVNTLSGISYSSVSPAAQDATLRNRAAEIMKEMGGRSFERSYIPDYELEQMDAATRAEAEQWMSLMQLLSKRAKERRALENLRQSQLNN